MKEWLDDFYGSPSTHSALETSLGPIFTDLGGAVAVVAGSEVGITNPAVAGFVQAMVSTYIDNYLDSSRVQLTELLDSPDPKAAIQQRLAEWIEKRPGKVADEATFKTANAVTQTVYKDAGVTRKKWSARGKSCPYCKKMNGRIVGIDKPFHNAGDTIEVPDSEIAAKAAMNFTHDIGHPPQHGGCDCVIEAELESISPGQTDLGLQTQTAGEAAMERLHKTLPGAELALEGIDDALAVEVASAMDKMAREYPSIAAKVGRMELSDFGATNAYAEVVTDAGHIGEGGRWIAGTGKSTIKLSTKHWADPDTLREGLNINEVMGWAPPGASSPESIIVHEFGHVLDADSKIDFQRAYLRAGNEGELISRYAAENYAERFAENFRAIYYTPKDKWTLQVKALDTALRRQRNK